MIFSWDKHYLKGLWLFTSYLENGKKSVTVKISWGSPHCQTSAWPMVAEAEVLLSSSQGLEVSKVEDECVLQEVTASER